MMTAQELTRTIESRLEELGSRVDKAKSCEEVLQYLKFASAFHQYSLSNTLSIWFHCPHATHVAGYRAWSRHSRWVKPGEKGIPLYAPCSARKDEDDDTKAVTFFKVVYVFDVSQTEGKPLPEAPITVQGGDRGLLPLLESLANSKGIQLAYVKLSGDHHGTAYADSRIEVSAELDDAGRASVLCHELAHSLCHFGDDRAETTQKQREIEAEVTSYIVTTHFGLDSEAPNYLALWDATGEEVMLSFKRIHATASGMIKAIEAMKGEVLDAVC